MSVTFITDKDVPNLANRIDDLESGTFSNAEGKGLSSNDYTKAEKEKLEEFGKLGITTLNGQIIDIWEE